MQVSAETYIVISLMFAVFAAVAAVGTSVVLGAGFERLRLGFELVKKQTGFFADAIYKLDLKTQKLDEETAQLKAGVYGMTDRMNRIEKRTDFMADAVTSLESRILQGSPSHPATVQQTPLQMEAMPVHHDPVTQRISVYQEWEKPESLMTGMYDDDHAPSVPPVRNDIAMDDGNDDHDSPHGIGTLLTRYFLGENDKGVIYH